jgi:ABC-type xylose transport system permease subunit
VLVPLHNLIVVRSDVDVMVMYMLMVIIKELEITTSSGVVTTLQVLVLGVQQMAIQIREFKYPYGLTVDATANVYVLVPGHNIRKISSIGRGNKQT